MWGPRPAAIGGVPKNSLPRPTAANACTADIQMMKNKATLGNGRFGAEHEINDRIGEEKSVAGHGRQPQLPNVCFRASRIRIDTLVVCCIHRLETNPPYAYCCYISRHYWTALEQSWRKRVGVEPTRDRLATPAGFEDRPPHRGTTSSVAAIHRRVLTARSTGAPHPARAGHGHHVRGECNRRDRKIRGSG